VARGSWIRLCQNTPTMCQPRSRSGFSGTFEMVAADKASWSGEKETLCAGTSIAALAEPLAILAARLPLPLPKAAKGRERTFNIASVTDDSTVL
jgi:hypothetical protein